MTQPAETPVTRAELQAEAERIIERDGMPDDTTQLAELVIGYFTEMDAAVVAGRGAADGEVTA